MEEPLSTVTPFPDAVAGQPQQPRLLDRVRIAIRTQMHRLSRTANYALSPGF